MIPEQIKDHFENKKYTKLTRAVGNGEEVISHGYIVGYSANFILLQENHDFELNGYCIYPIAQIKKIRFNRYDRYFHKMFVAEGLIEKVGIGYAIILDDWITVFESIKTQKEYVIIECEHPEINSFTIGPIMNTTKKKVAIRDFDPTGYLDEDLSEIKFKNITRVCFDDNYINTISKYLRHRKPKSKK